jgi:hypothetical protein
MTIDLPSRAQDGSPTASKSGPVTLCHAHRRRGPRRVRHGLAIAEPTTTEWSAGAQAGRFCGVGTSAVKAIDCPSRDHASASGETPINTALPPSTVRTFENAPAGNPGDMRAVGRPARRLHAEGTVRQTTRLLIAGRDQPQTGVRRVTRAVVPVFEVNHAPAVGADPRIARRTPVPDIVGIPRRAARPSAGGAQQQCEAGFPHRFSLA